MKQAPFVFIVNSILNKMKKNGILIKWYNTHGKCNPNQSRTAFLVDELDRSLIWFTDLGFGIALSVNSIGEVDRFEYANPEEFNIQKIIKITEEHLKSQILLMIRIDERYKGIPC